LTARRMLRSACAVACACICDARTAPAPAPAPARPPAPALAVSGAVIAPMMGCDSATDYYTQASSGPLLSRARVTAAC
jgi:hypothetical protein